MLELTFEIANDGTLPKRVAKQIRAWVKQHAGGTVMWTLGRPRRSTRANAYYWCCIATIQRGYLVHTGTAYADWALHEHYKATYLPVVAAEWLHEYGEEVEWAQQAETPGGVVKRRLTTTQLDPAQFAAYVDLIQQDEAVLAMGLDFEPVPTGLRSGRILEPAA